MNATFTHNYRGPVQALVLDWAGTTVDFGSFAPTAVFMRLFAEYGIQITADEARSGMGLMKKEHLAHIAGQPAVQARWQAVHGALPTPADLDKMFADFVPMQVACIAEYSQPIPGLQEAIADVRARKIKIGTTTGYTRPIMAELLVAAAEYGYTPDCCVCSDEAPSGRPFPWMCYRVATELRVYPMAAMVKVGDTIVDVEEGLNAGMWSVGIALTGNLVGLTAAEIAQLEPDERRGRRDAAADLLHRAGAHYVVDSIADVPALIDKIESRLATGEKP